MRDTRPSIVVIDDDPSVRQSFRYLLKDSFRILTAPGALEGEFYLSLDTIDIVLLDIRLRGADGMEVLARIRDTYPTVEVIMITAYASLETIRAAIRLGAFDYLIKPFDREDLSRVIRKALKRRMSRMAMFSELYKLRESSLYLEDLLKKAHTTMHASGEWLVTAALENIQSRDGYTRSHAERVAALVSRIAAVMQMEKSDRELLTCAAYLHDIGKVRVDDRLLNRQYQFSTDDYEAMKRHALDGAELIRPFPFLEGLCPSIRHHHEQYDGSGYPDGLRGTEIPLYSRILSVADAADAMVHSPVRTRRRTVRDVGRELQLRAGRQFDPDVVDLVMKSNLLPLT
jgi:putative nucleotidyltransferase with HDIG domain